MNLFMWEYQQHFQISLQVSAESLFNEIDSKLKPEVFLIGILVDPKENQHLVCIEPEDCGYSVNSFTKIKTLAGELEDVDEDKKTFHTDDTLQENHDKYIKNNSYREAILRTLNQSDSLKNTEKFISFPTLINNYLVFAVLKLQKDVINKYYSLTKDKFNNRYKINRSFLESAIDIYLKECTNSFKDSEKAIGAIERLPEELLREAAKQFMYSVSQAGGNMHGLHGLYDACNVISSLKYEGSEGLGTIIIAKKGHPNIKLTLQLNEPIAIKDFRKVRKFLEVSSSTSLIISDSAYIYGLGEQIEKYNPKEESLFAIKFISHFKWEVIHDENKLMIVEFKQPSLPKDRIDKDKFYSDFRRIFKNIENEQIADLWGITIQATKQSHGTMLVITDNAKNETERLGQQSFSLRPFKLTNEVIQQITSIDGAVLLDRNSICYSIGVILDGLATDKGDSSRGARYNSAVRYYEYFGKDTPTILIIISEDGMINLIPNLKPQIKHSKIVEAIHEFKSISLTDKPNKKLFNQLMDLFEKIQFYLTKEECKTINQCRKKIEKKNIDNSFRILRSDLSANDEMNTSYYIED